MRGLGRASAAISVVNALFCGQGAAVAVALRCEVSVEVIRLAPGELGEVRLAALNSTPIVRACLQRGLREFLPHDQYRVEATVRSEIPAGRGLKSSSAVSTAVLEALARAGARAAPPETIARLASEVAEDLGLSATGAYDDALAAIGGGGVCTDNASRRLLGRFEPDPSWRVTLWVPPGEHAPTPELAPRFAPGRAVGEEAFARARAGDWLAAMDLNGRAVERAMGYDYATLRSRLREAGALAAGVTGCGPALAIVAPGDRSARVRAALPAERGQTIEMAFRPASNDRGPTSQEHGR